MVVVGSLDPYWKYKRLQNLGDSIANAINFANESKEKKRAKVRSEFEDALKLGQQDPEAGVLAMDDLEERYKEKLLDKSVPERRAYRSLMTKQQDEDAVMYGAWKKFAEAAVVKKGELAEMQRKVQATPKVTGLDPMTTSQEEYTAAMMSYAQGNVNAMQKENPEYTRKAQTLQKMSDPNFLAQAAYAELGTEERIYFQKWLNEEGLELDQVLGMADKTSYSPTVQAAVDVESGKLTGLGAQTARIQAGLDQSPADVAKQTWQMGKLEIGGKQTRQTAEARHDYTTAEESQRQANRLEAENLRQRDGSGAGAAGGGGADEAAAGQTVDQVFQDRKSLSKSKYPASTDTQLQLKALIAEAQQRFPEAPEGLIANKIIDRYERAFDAAEGRDAKKREAKALEALMEEVRRGVQ